MKNVTVIVPVYNSELYISKCLDSILSQTYQDFEILVINDGSKDNSLKILEEYSKEHSEKIKLINQENKGVAQTRNESILKSDSKYVMFIDNDDYIDGDYIETFVQEAEKGDFDVVIGGYRRITEKLKILREQTLEDTDWSKFIIMAPWAKIYKKEYLINNNISFLKNNIGEDVYFNLKAMFASNKIKIIDYIGYNWFYNTESVSNTIQKNIMQLDVHRLMDESYKMLEENDLLKKNYELVMTYFTRYIIWILSFSTKGLDYKTISIEYDKLFYWLDQRFPDYKSNKNISFFKPAGEDKKQRIAQKLFLIANNLHLGKLMVYANSKI